MRDNWWFDGEASECYYAWGEHANKEEFIDFVISEELAGNDIAPEIAPEDIEYLWAKELDSEMFEIVPEDTPGAVPVTRYSVF
jgi:hypothetical protein